MQKAVFVAIQKAVCKSIAQIPELGFCATVLLCQPIKVQARDAKETPDQLLLFPHLPAARGPAFLPVALRQGGRPRFREVSRA